MACKQNIAFFGLSVLVLSVFFHLGICGIHISIYQYLFHSRPISQTNTVIGHAFKAQIVWNSDRVKNCFAAWQHNRNGHNYSEPFPSKKGFCIEIRLCSTTSNFRICSWHAFEKHFDSPSPWSFNQCSIIIRNSLNIGFVCGSTWNFCIRLSRLHHRPTIKIMMIGKERLVCLPANTFFSCRFFACLHTHTSCIQCTSSN